MQLEKNINFWSNIDQTSNNYEKKHFYKKFKIYLIPTEKLWNFIKYVRIPSGIQKKSIPWRLFDEFNKNSKFFRRGCHRSSFFLSNRNPEGITTKIPWQNFDASVSIRVFYVPTAYWFFFKSFRLNIVGTTLTTLSFRWGFSLHAFYPDISIFVGFLRDCWISTKKYIISRWNIAIRIFLVFCSDAIIWFCI